ncbi:MAG: hypothetical protein M3Z04_17665, partial [Chloroflexota bacterium]|nr:hypothetical protein [Chloroflexota bacterium]
MQRLSSVLWIGLLLLGSAFLPMQAQPTLAAPAPAPATAGCPPAPGAVGGLQQWGFNELYSVSARSSADAWAVGVYRTPNSDLSTLRPLIEHWDGANWTMVTPAPYDQTSKLVSVVALAANDVWAVGAGGIVVTGEQTPSRPLIEHWNGTAWSIVPSPPAGSAYSIAGLTGVTALAADNVWAVGYSQELSTAPQAFVIHWDGHAWTQVATPTEAAGLSGVSAVAADDIWAVGSVGFYGPGVMQSLHWNGTAWAVVAVPMGPGSLTAVSAHSPADVWAVGFAGEVNANTPLTLHWNGSAWTQVAAPAPAGSNALYGVVARAADDVWAVGRTGPTAYTTQ